MKKIFILFTLIILSLSVLGYVLYQKYNNGNGNSNKLFTYFNDKECKIVELKLN